MVNNHPCISKGKITRHQVKQLNKTEYVLFRDGGMKIQQDMLFVSIPIVELHDNGRLMRITLIQAGEGRNIEGRLRM